MYESKFTTQEAHTKGIDAEESFKKIALKKGHSITVTTTHQDIKQHIDLILRNDNLSITVDVKSIKDKTIDGKKVPQLDQSVIELKTVYGGLGWVYGKADFIAFENPTGFLLVDRKSLVEYSEKNKDNLKIEHHRWKYEGLALALAYGLNPNFENEGIDAFFWMTFDEMKKLPHEEWIYV